MLIVVFCEGYRARFTPALRKEADLICELHEKEGTPAYIFDHEAGHRAAEVESNLVSGTRASERVVGVSSQCVVKRRRRP